MEIKNVLDGSEQQRKREEEERVRIQKEREEAHRTVEAQRSLAGKVYNSSEQ